MDTIKQKVSYIRGLVDGLEIDESTKEGKVLLAIIDALEEIADGIEDMDAAYAELDDYVEAIDEDLADLEKEVYGDECDDDDDDGFIEVKCPNCNETVYLDEDLFDDEDEEIMCPNCHEPIHFECECCDKDED